MRAFPGADAPLQILGLNEASEFMASHMGGTRIELDPDLLSRQVVKIARRAIASDPDIGAFVMECTTLPSFSAAVQQATGRPVFDYIGLADWVYRAVVQHPYEGFL